MNADDLLRRLVAWEVAPIVGKDSVDFYAILGDARAYLNREKGPVAEGFIALYGRCPGGPGTPVVWRLRDYFEEREDGDEIIKVRIPVPAHIVSPPVCDGEVIE